MISTARIVPVPISHRCNLVSLKGRRSRRAIAASCTGSVMASSANSCNCGEPIVPLEGFFMATQSRAENVRSVTHCPLQWNSMQYNPGSGRGQSRRRKRTHFAWSRCSKSMRCSLLANTIWSDSRCLTMICTSIRPSASVNCKKTQACVSLYGKGGTLVGRIALKTFMRWTFSVPGGPGMTSSQRTMLLTTGCNHGAIPGPPFYRLRILRLEADYT